MRLNEKKFFPKILFFMVMFFGGSILIYRAFYGMDLTDESYYLATAKRFFDGDMLFREDWNRGQIFGLLMVPFYSAYVFLHGNNEGIILCSRILFVFLELFVSVFLYHILEFYTKDHSASMIAAACVLVYARGNIITISYYNLGFLTFLLAILCWMNAEKLKGGVQWFVLSGFNFAVSVLCMPYMVILFIVLTGFGAFWIKNEDIEKSRKVFWFVMGVVISAIIFIIYFWKMIPWARLLEYVPIVFSDPGLEQEGIVEQFFALSIYIITIFLKYMWPVYGLTFVVAFMLGRRWIKCAVIEKGFLGVLWIEFIFQSVYVRSYFEGGIVLTFLLMVLQVQLLYPDHRLKCLERFFLIPGLLFACVWIIGSNVDVRVMNMGILLMDLWAIPFLGYILQECKKSIRVIMFFPAFSMFIMLFVIRCFDIYRDGDISKLTYKISIGGMKGIYTEESRGVVYEKMIEILRGETGPDNVIAVLGYNPWVYMEVSALCGSYTTWKLETDDILTNYYGKFPERVPDIILIVPKELNVYESWKYSSHGVGINNEEQPVIDGALVKLIKEGGYILEKKDECILYRRYY